VVNFGLDEKDVLPRTETLGDILTVGNWLTKRPDKGGEVLKVLDRRMNICTVGAGNEDLRGNAGSAPYGEMASFYAGYKVYFNPGPVLCGSVAEAMMAGMPVVTMTPQTYTDLIINGVNGFIASNPKEAAERMMELVKNGVLRARVGEAAKSTALARFSMKKHIEGWNSVFHSVAESACAA
jgi:glycosyltransferase involved in cell wall biosynthesis